MSKSITLAGQSSENHGAFTKWDLLHMEARKKQDKTDRNHDEIALERDRENYTFQPNKDRSYLSGVSSVSGSFHRKPSVKAPLDQGRNLI